MADCGACNLCCKLLAVPDISKPSQMLCWWTGVHGGCERHKEKDSAPELGACAQFKCLWLASQANADPTKRQGRYMRPDMTHVVMGPPHPSNPNMLFVQVDPAFPAAWKEPEIDHYLKTNIIENGGMVEIIIGETRIQFNG